MVDNCLKKKFFNFMATYNKLVRDLIPEIIASKGETCKTHIATSEEYEQKLLEKVLEEAQELKDDHGSVEELVDLMEVLDAVVDLKEYSWDQIKQIQKEKAEKRGSFKKKIVLEES